MSSKPKSTERKPFKPRPARSAEERLPRLYRSLTDQVDDGYFENAKKTCKKILSLDSKSTSAFQTLLFLYLHTDDYSLALDLVISASQANKKEEEEKERKDKYTEKTTLEFERAYCLYRLHREKEALEIIEAFGEKGRREKHLEAQIRYRLGEYEHVQQIYDDLIATVDSTSPEYEDITTNLTATATHLAFITHEYQAHLAAPASDASNSGLTPYTPTDGDLESYVPSIPAGWSSRVSPGEKKSAAVASNSTSALGAMSKDKEKEKEKGKEADKERGGKVRSKPRHRLPKGAMLGKPFNLDPERWMPMRQRASYVAAQSKKKGAKESMGTGFTQGSTASVGGGAGAGGGGGVGGSGGGKNKKGKKK